MTFRALEKLHRLSDGYIQHFVVDNTPILLLQNDGQRYAFINRCPHQDAPLTFATITGGCIRCPMHGISFDLKTGAATNGMNMHLQDIPLVYEGNNIGVCL